MTVQFRNYDYYFTLLNKKIFVPSKIGRRIGNELKKKIERAYIFDDFFYHLKPGGHVSAIHAHRENLYFCKVDIENFFYSIGRNRVVRILREINIPRAEHYGRWSCVKSSNAVDSYALPYGFVQSPIIATLAIAKSAIGDVLRHIPSNITVTVYVDDISLSSSDRTLLCDYHSELLRTIVNSGFKVNKDKCVVPRDRLTIFNCELIKGKTFVLEDRIKKFYEKNRSSKSCAGFERYRASVECGNE